METCRICHFEMTLDDTALESETGKPVCLRCYARLTGTELRMPRKLRLQLQACMTDVAVSGTES